VHAIWLAGQDRRTCNQEHNELILHVSDGGFQAGNDLLQPPPFLSPTRTTAAGTGTPDHQADALGRTGLRIAGKRTAHRTAVVVLVLVMATSVPAGCVQRVVASVHLFPQRVELPQHGMVRDAPLLCLLHDDVKTQQ